MHQPGIEPGAQRWQRWILPLNHWCWYLSSPTNNMMLLRINSVLYHSNSTPVSHLKQQISMQHHKITIYSYISHISKKYTVLYSLITISQSHPLCVPIKKTPVDGKIHTHLFIYIVSSTFFHFFGVTSIWCLFYKEMTSKWLVK